MYDRKENMTQNPRLILPVAPPGAGKSYTACKLCQVGLLQPEDVVEPDYYRWLLTGDRANQESNKTVFDIVNAIVLSRLNYGMNVYLDATNINSSHRIALLDKVRVLPSEVQLIVLISGENLETLKRWNENRPYPVPQRVLQRMWKGSQEFQIESLKKYKPLVYSIEDALTWEEIP